MKKLHTVLFTALIYTINAQSPGTIDESFMTGWHASRSVQCGAIQSDGKILLGGEFSTFNDFRCNGIVRLNEDLSVDPTFNVGTGKGAYYFGIYAIAIQADGKILIGGYFNSFEGHVTNHIERLNTDGSVDTSFHTGTGAGGFVFDILIQPDQKIIVAGAFSTFNDVMKKNIVRLKTNGSIDNAFNTGTGTDGIITALDIQDDGKILAVGDFTKYKGHETNRITRINLNGSFDDSFNVGTGASNKIEDVDIQPDGKILVAGKFNSFNGVSLKKIARLHTDGSVDDTFSSGFGSDIVTTIHYGSDDKVYVGGDFSNYNSEFFCDGYLRLHANGTYDTSFSVSPQITQHSKGVSDILIQEDGKIIICAYEEININHTITYSFARLNIDGSTDASYFPEKYGLNVQGRKAMELQPDGKILVSSANVDEVSCIYDTVITNGFIRINGDASIDNTFSPPPLSVTEIRDIALQPDGNVLAAGKGGIVRLHADGSIDELFNYTDTEIDPIYTIEILNDGKILIGGYDDTAPKYSVKKLHPNGSVDISANLGTITDVYDIAIQHDGK
ncbi:MAG: delta-60 repeat domain-containing protein, partial [Chitinophagales bacterium]|nr:delta-60 repeat domain-containing protein [Chitinophagales bacterium]